MVVTQLPALPEYSRQNFFKFLRNFSLITIFILSSCFSTILVFFAYEEYCDLYRYSEFGIRPPKDEYHQSQGKFDASVTVNYLKHILGEKGAKTFAYLDRDGNGLISAAELEPALHLIRSNRNHPVSCFLYEL